jgi:hypothetical protein
MSARDRILLSLGTGKVSQPQEGDEDGSVPVGLFDVLLPSRRFVIHHKVAVLGQVSLTAEFLLRLLHAVDGMHEQDVAQFFGFNATEMAFVVGEAESRSYVVRRNGRILLTDAGYALFKDGERPQIFEVERRIEKVAFDLLALAPCEWERLSDFEHSLPELEILDQERAATASKFVPDAFRRHYSEIVGRKEKDVSAASRRSLYSVDDVAAGDRFMSLVPVLAVASTKRPDNPEPVLDAWKSGHELADRNPVVHSIASFLDDLKIARTTDHEEGFRTLQKVAPDYLKDYMTRDGLSVMRYFKETSARAGELRADRPTVGLIGPLFTPDNSNRLLEAFQYSASENKIVGSGELLWVVPSSVTWGTSRALPILIDRVVGELSADPTGNWRCVPTAMVSGKPPRHLLKAFHRIVLRPVQSALSPALEIFLVPRRLVAVVVHAPLAPGVGFPVPLGLLSFDKRVVRSVHALLCANLPKYLDIVGSNERFDFEAFSQWKIDAPSGAPTENQ